MEPEKHKQPEDEWEQMLSPRSIERLIEEVGTSPALEGMGSTLPDMPRIIFGSLYHALWALEEQLPRCSPEIAAVESALRSLQNPEPLCPKIYGWVRELQDISTSEAEAEESAELILELAKLLESNHYTKQAALIREQAKGISNKV